MPPISHLRRDLFRSVVLLGSRAEIAGRSSGERRSVCHQIAASAPPRDAALGRAVGFKACRKEALIGRYRSCLVVAWVFFFLGASVSFCGSVCPRRALLRLGWLPSFCTRQYPLGFSLGRAHSSVLPYPGLRTPQNLSVRSLCGSASHHEPQSHVSLGSRACWHNVLHPGQHIVLSEALEMLPGSPAELETNVSFHPFHGISVSFYFAGSINWVLQEPLVFQQMGSPRQAEAWFLLPDKNTVGQRESQT